MPINYLFIAAVFLVFAPDIAAWVTADHAALVAKAFPLLVLFYAVLRWTPLVHHLTKRHDAAFFVALWAVEFALASTLIGSAFVAYHLISLEDAVTAVANLALPGSGVAGPAVAP